MNIIEFVNVSKTYNESVVVKNLNLKIKRGDITVFIGKSGGGKTTALEMINKMVDCDEGGEIYIFGKEIKTIDPLELRRNMGYCVQGTYLFPHMNVNENISYVLDITKQGKLVENKVSELLDLVGLGDVERKYPRELSGGEAQRVGVARALANNSNIILMDEPFGALDNITRTSLQDKLLEIQRKLNKTIVFVTHDLNEAKKLGDVIVLFNNGEIEQKGSFDDLVNNPSNEYVREFMSM